MNGLGGSMRALPVRVALIVAALVLLMPANERRPRNLPVRA